MRYKPKHKTPQELLLSTGFQDTEWGWVKTREQYLKEGIIKKRYGKVFRVHCFITSDRKLDCHCDRYSQRTIATEFTGGKHETVFLHHLLNDQRQQFIREDI